MNKYRTEMVAAAAILVAASVVVVPALATPSTGFSRIGFSTGVLQALDVRTEEADTSETSDRNDEWELRLKTKAASDLGLDQLSILPSGHSGWHSHAGITLVTVTAGEVVWYDGASPDCGSKTYRVGDSFVEQANNIHLVRNTSGATAVFTAVQIRPKDSPGRIDAARPASCPII